MTSPEQAARLGLSDFHHMLASDGRLFRTDAQTPCHFQDPGRDLWFSPFRDRERAARQCLGCPFLGRCGYNAVASRATHGVWGGEVLPGDKPAELEPIYARLLVQFQDRRAIELGDAPAPPLPNHTARRRRRAAA
jgi:transcription factor WhiB